MLKTPDLETGGGLLFKAQFSLDSDLPSSLVGRETKGIMDEITCEKFEEDYTYCAGPLTSTERTAMHNLYTSYETGQTATFRQWTYRFQDIACELDPNYPI